MSREFEMGSGEARPRLWCHPKTLKKVRELAASLPRGAKVLDAGAGEGPLTLVLKEDGLNVSACDLDPSRFRVAGVECVRANLDEKLPFSDGIFDAVFALEAVEHLENVSHFLRETHRILKSGGRAILTTPNILNFASRLRFLFSGFHSLFTRPLAETGADFRHAHRHALPYPTLRYELMRARFSIETVTTDKFRKSAMALM